SSPATSRRPPAGPRTMDYSLRLRPRISRRRLRGRRPPCTQVAGDELGSERALGRMLVVRSAAQPQVLGGGFTAPRDRLHVIELEHAARRAAPPVVAHERALAPIASPHLTLHRGWDVAGRRA